MNSPEILQNDDVIEDNMPIYFLDLSVQNVRCFGKLQTLDLSDGQGKPARWTVILGDNGTGKTTLLKCLAGLEPTIQHTSKGIVWFPKAYTQLRYKEERILFYNFTFHRDPKKTFYVLASNFYKGRFDEPTGSIIEGYYFEHLRAGGRPKEQLNNANVYAYGASRRMGQSSLSETKDSDTAASLFFDDVSLINAEEWLLQAYFAIQNSEGETQAYFEKRYNKIKETLILLLEDAQDFRIKPVTKDQPNPAIEVKTPYGLVDMKDLSLGYQALIAWVVDLASRLFDRYPDSENPLAEPAIVLVDEIDLHLHPRWQRTIITYLTDIFKNTQFIVTAHSPLVVQAMPKDANIVLLKREGDQVIIHNDKEKDIIYGWRLDQLITSDLFDVPSSRPFQYDKLLKRRNEILSKAQLGAEDQKELEKVEQQLEELPVTDSLQDHQAMELIRKAAQILKPHIDKVDDKNNKAIKHT